MRWTLEDYLTEAGIGDIPVWADKVLLNDEFDEPFKHQVTGLSQAAYWERFGLYDDTGTGKTLISQGYSAFQIGLGNKVLAVMPPILLGQFTDSLEENLEGITNYISVHTLNQIPKKRQELFSEWNRDEWPDLLLMSYQMFLKHWRDLKLIYRVLIADEAHALKNPSSKIHSSVYGFLDGRDQNDSNALLMTGTPIHNGLKDAYGLIRIVTPDRYSSYDNFTSLHCVFNTEVKYEQIVAYKNHDFLYRSLYLQARRILKGETLDLPPKIMTTVPITLHPTHQKLYDKLKRERILLVGDEIIDATQDASLRMKLMRIVTCPENFTESKIVNHWLQGMDEIVDSVNPQEHKIILFGHFNATIEKTLEHYSKFNPAAIYGGSMCKNPQAEKERFQTDDNCRMLVAHPKSAGAGLDFQKVCSNVYFIEPTGVPGDVTQCSDRVYRAGQDDPVNIWFSKVLNTNFVETLTRMMQKEREANLIYRDDKELIVDMVNK